MVAVNGARRFADLHRFDDGGTVAHIHRSQRAAQICGHVVLSTASRYRVPKHLTALCARTRSRSRADRVLRSRAMQTAAGRGWLLSDWLRPDARKMNESSRAVFKACVRRSSCSI